MLMSRAYPFGGVFVMRDRAELAVSPDSTAPAGTEEGGVQPDQAVPEPSFDMNVAGHPLFLDPGTVATPRGTFHWESALQITADIWFATPAFDILEARVAHEADTQTVVHRRRIMRVGSGWWLITDDIAPNTVPFELQLQCESSVSPTRETDSTLRLSRPLGPDVLVHVAGPKVSPWHISEAWVSPEFGAQKPAKAVGCSVGQEGGRSSMLICQESDSSVELVTPEADGGECISVHGPEPAYVLVKAPGVDYVRSEVGRTDADVAWIWPATNERSAHYLGIRGTRVELQSGLMGTLGGDNGWASGPFGNKDQLKVGTLNRPDW